MKRKSRKKKIALHVRLGLQQAFRVDIAVCSVLFGRIFQLERDSTVIKGTGHWQDDRNSVPVRVR